MGSLGFKDSGLGFRIFDFGFGAFTGTQAESQAFGFRVSGSLNGIQDCRVKLLRFENPKP